MRYKSSRSWKITKPIRAVYKLVFFFWPVVPLKVGGFDCDDRQPFINIIARKWVRIKAIVLDDYPCQITVNSNLKLDVKRWPTLSLQAKTGHSEWISRLNNELEEYDVAVVRGNVKSLEVFKISSFRAWCAILFSRWTRGRTLGRALKLSARLLKSFKVGGISSVLQELRPSEFKVEGDYQNWLSIHDNAQSHTCIGPWLDRLSHKPKISVILPVYNSKYYFSFHKL